MSPQPCLEKSYGESRLPIEIPRFFHTFRMRKVCWRPSGARARRGAGPRLEACNRKQQARQRRFFGKEGITERENSCFPPRGICRSNPSEARAGERLVVPLYLLSCASAPTCKASRPCRARLLRRGDKSRIILFYNSRFLVSAAAPALLMPERASATRFL